MFIYSFICPFIRVCVYVCSVMHTSTREGRNHIQSLWIWNSGWLCARVPCAGTGKQPLPLQNRKFFQPRTHNNVFYSTNVFLWLMLLKRRKYTELRVFNLKGVHSMCLSVPSVVFDNWLTTKFGCAGFLLTLIVQSRS